MADFGSLPVELVQKIIGYVVVYDEGAPVIGHNAIATDVFHWYKTKQEASVKNQSKHEDSQALPRPVEDGSEKKDKENGYMGNSEVENSSFVCSLKQMRLTCRYLNQLCIPFLFLEVNLLTRRQVKYFSTIQELILIPYAQYIQVLRLAIGRRFPAASILTTCYNIRSLSLYITHYAIDYIQLVDPIRRLLGSFVPCSKLDNDQSQEDTSGKLTSLGLYYQGLINGHIDFSDIYDYWDPRHCLNVAGALLSGILDPDENMGDDQKESISIPIQTLDLVTGPISTWIWMLMQTRLGNLKSLSLRCALHEGLKRAREIGDKIWDPIKPTQCAFRRSLTQLYLRDCDGVVAMEVPGLVQFFYSLKDFAIIACGGSSYVPVVKRPRGWSISDPWLSTWGLPEDSEGANPTTRNNAGIATSRRIRALDTYHVEHIDKREIMILGTIPSRTFILVSRQITRALADDPEIFPCVEVLRIFAGTKQDVVMLSPETRENEGQGENEGGGEHEGNTMATVSLDALCNARGIELRRDLPDASGCPGCRPSCMFI